MCHMTGLPRRGYGYSALPGEVNEANLSAFRALELHLPSYGDCTGDLFKSHLWFVAQNDSSSREDL